MESRIAAARNFRTALTLASAFVAQHRAQAPAGFDPQNAAAAPAAPTEEVAGKNGYEADGEMMGMVMGQLGMSGALPAAFGGADEKEETGETETDPNVETEEDVAREGAKGAKSEGDEEEAETDPNAPSGEEEKTESEQTETEEDTAAELTPEVQAVVDTAVTEATTPLQERISELETQLAEVEAKGTPSQAVRAHPVMLAEKPEQIDEFEARLNEFEEWALKHWDGYTAESEGFKEGEQEYTGAQIRQRHKELKEQREKLIPQARQLLEARQKMAVVSRKIYPELFDPKKPEFTSARAFLAKYPDLKSDPMAWVFIGDSLRGEKARIAEEKARAAKAKQPAGKAPTRTVSGKAVAPKVPTTAKSAPKTATATQRANGNVDVAKFVKSGGDRNALVSAIMGSNVL